MDPSDDDLIPLDRWVVPLGDTADPPAPLPGQPPAGRPVLTDPPADLLRFPLDADVPGEGYQPRLLRFGKAG